MDKIKSMLSSHRIIYWPNDESTTTPAMQLQNTCSQSKTRVLMPWFTLTFFYRCSPVLDHPSTATKTSREPWVSLCSVESQRTQVPTSLSSFTTLPCPAQPPPLLPLSGPLDLSCCNINSPPQSLIPLLLILTALWMFLSASSFNQPLSPPLPLSSSLRW